MEKKPERRGLGRGLSALMADVNLSNAAPAGTEGRAATSEARIAVEKIFPNPNQPRRDFDAEALQELAASIASKGIIQPLVVRSRSTPGEYEIVAGERRWRAAQLAQVHEVPVVVRSFSDDEVLEIAIIENIQRTDLNAVEEALGFRQLMDRFGHTQEKLAEALAKSRSHIANTLRLLSLPEDVLSLVRHGKISAGHARALIGSADPSALARKVVASQMSVREAEKLARAVTTKPKAGRKSAEGPASEKDADTKAIEADLSANLGMMVTISHGASGEGGTLSISYRDLDQLDMLCQVLSVIPRDFGR